MILIERLAGNRSQPLFQFLLISMLTMSTLWGQSGIPQSPTQERGASSHSGFQFGEIDSVNLFNGNLTLSIPIGMSYPAGGGLEYQLL